MFALVYITGTTGLPRSIRAANDRENDAAIIIWKAKLKVHSDNDKQSACRGDRFSSACTACRSRNPRQRFASTTCGHAFCSYCCTEGLESCPVCPESDCTTFVRLFEERDSRQCGICFETPFERVFFIGCGHIICAACSVGLHLNANIDNDGIFNGDDPPCPFCRTVSPCKTLVEQVVETKKTSGAEGVDVEKIHYFARRAPLRRLRAKPLQHARRSNRIEMTRLKLPQSRGFRR